MEQQILVVLVMSLAVVPVGIGAAFACGPVGRILALVTSLAFTAASGFYFMIAMQLGNHSATFVFVTGALLVAIACGLTARAMSAKRRAIAP